MKGSNIKDMTAKAEKRIIVVGGGAAGMMAALSAQKAGAAVLLLEKNRNLGRKLAITGKGRCNLTNMAPIEDFLQHIPGNGRFMNSALRAFSNQDTVEFFESLGVPLKTERGQRVFPQSDRAADIVQALRQALLAVGVELRLGMKAEAITAEAGHVAGVRTAGSFLPADAVILATGGLSYPATGSTGDGYRFARELGHEVTPLSPSLVSLRTQEGWPARLSGLSLRNVRASLYRGKKLLGEEFGEMLFTHEGVSGPIILTLSRAAAAALAKDGGEPLQLFLDWKPALSPEQLDARLQRDLEKFSRRHFANSLTELLPSSAIPVFVSLSGIPPEKPAHQISRAERLRLGELLKKMPLTVTALGPYEEAIITAGGVKVSEVDPKSMQSRLLPGLFFAGEVLDVDGLTGGFNLQIAFSTGWAAGKAAAMA